MKEWKEWKNGQGRVGNRAEEGVAGEAWHGRVAKFFLPPPSGTPPWKGGFGPSGRAGVGERGGWLVSQTKYRST